MRILFPIGTFFPAQTGGPDNTLYWLINEISKDKEFQISVVTTLYGIKSEQQKKYRIVPNQVKSFDDNFSVIYFKLNSKNTFSPMLMKWLLKKIQNYDFVFITSFFNHHSILTAFLCKFRKIPFIISPRGELRENAFKYGNKSKRLKFLYINIFKNVYNKAIYHVTSIEEEIDVRKIFPDAKIELLSNLTPVKSDISINRNRKNILFLGRLNAIKGIENLIEAYSQLSEEIKIKHKLIIAGAGQNEYKNKLEELCKHFGIRNSVEFVGHVEGKEKENLYLNSKVFVLPSYSENFANVVIEAINCGIYVITSKNTPWNELANLKIGSWINNAPEILGEEIERILKLSNEDLFDISLKALNYLKNNFDVTRNIKKYKKMIINYLER